MNTKLEKYITMHKEELSSFTPSDQLWLAVSGSIAKPALIASKVSWLKYFAFSASAAALVVSLTLISKKENNSGISQKNESKPVTEEATIQPAATQQEPKNTQPLMVSVAAVPDTPTAPAYAPVFPVPPVPPVAPAAQLSPVTAPAAVPALPAAPASSALPVPLVPEPIKGEAIKWTKTENGEMQIDTSFAGIKKVVLSVSSCDVFIQPSVLDKVFLKANISSEKKGIVIGGLPQYELLYALSDSVLNITLQNKCKKTVVVAGSINESAIINLDIPDNIPVSVKNSYGNIIAKGLKNSKSQFESSSGDIMLNDMTTDLQIKSGYGYFSAANTKGNINAQVTSGDISIDKLEGNAEINSAYGNQVYKQITGNIKSRSTSGDVQVEKMNGDMDVKSNYGNISLNTFDGIPMLEAVSGDISGKDVRIKGNMTAKSSYGNIRISLLNDIKELSFDLKTSYGKINVNKDGAKAEDDATVSIKQGNYLITGITTSGDQSYK